MLRKRDDVVLAIATGGWAQTAKLKLESAGIEYTGISFASSSDNTSRTGIMKIAEERCSTHEFATKSYFGDAIWDKRAAHELSYNFILVGNRVSHPSQIMNFKYSNQALELIGL